jgi:peroxiredoxin
MLPLGTKAPGFDLINAVDGERVSLDDFESAPALLVMFICNHCPYVQHIRSELGRLASDYMDEGLAIVAINSNDSDAYPQDGPEHMRRLAREEGWEFPFLFDEEQEVARAYRAVCTPEFYLFDADRRLVYHGQLDDSRPGMADPTGRDLRAAIDAVLSGDRLPEDQRPSVGCSIKWKPAKRPDYA